MPRVLGGPRGMGVFLWARYPCTPGRQGRWLAPPANEGYVNELDATLSIATALYVTALHATVLYATSLTQGVALALAYPLGEGARAWSVQARGSPGEVGDATCTGVPRS